MSVDQILLAVERPPVPLDAPDWFRIFVGDPYSNLVQQVRVLQQSFRSSRETVAGAAGSKSVTFAAPYPDANYSVSAVPSWSTTVYVTAISATGFTVTFGTAAPGGGGTLYVLAVR